MFIDAQYGLSVATYTRELQLRLWALPPCICRQLATTIYHLRYETYKLPGIQPDSKNSQWRGLSVFSNVTYLPDTLSADSGVERHRDGRR
jgi:hypothetical protein